MKRLLLFLVLVVAFRPLEFAPSKSERLGNSGTGNDASDQADGTVVRTTSETRLPEPPGWFAGDPHVHRGIGCGRSGEKDMLSPQELLEGMKPNNLAVISVLGDIGNGEINYPEKDIALIDGKDHPASTPGRILHWDAEWHYDPRGVTFDQKVIGGHLILLGLKQAKRVFSEYTYPIFEWARQQGAIGGFAHAQYLKDEIPKELDCCAPLEYPVETALGTSSFLMEDVNGGESALRAYYRLLNCGFRPGLVAATDYPCNHLEPFGRLLTYVFVGSDKFSYREWGEGMARGRTVVSRNGHNEFLDLKINGSAMPGDEVGLSGKTTVAVKIVWSVAKPLTGTIELVRNGAVAGSRQGSASPGSPLILETTQPFEKSGWLCARRMDGNGHQSHTGAVFIVVKNAPVRASASDGEFFVRWIDNLIEQTSPGGAWSEYFPHERAAAQCRYKRARAIFKRITEEARRESEN